MKPFSCSAIGPGHVGRHRSPDPVPAEPGRWPKLAAALAVVNRDVRATLPDQDPLVLMCVPSCEPPTPTSVGGDQIYVALPDGRWHGNPVNARDLEAGDPLEPDDAETVLSVVAEAAQETLMELLWQAWPVCPAHRTGTHLLLPRTDDGYPSGADPQGPPVWWCGGGPGGVRHAVSLVGEWGAAPSP
ncbi:hypothetical protein ACFYPN_28685 [Streptomyces sp. NPDC005576]|uniref:hypothetical protein n=1 Tax=unclassified Streptomyces TaxID=2593676 RepID=UPI0033C921D2